MPRDLTAGRWLEPNSGNLSESGAAAELLPIYPDAHDRPVSDPADTGHRRGEMAEGAWLVFWLAMACVLAGFLMVRA